MARNWPGHTIRFNDELWDGLDLAIKTTHHPELTRSMAIRELIRWWIDPDAKGLWIGLPRYTDDQETSA